MDDLILETINYMGLSFPIKGPLILNDPNQLYLKVCAYLNQDAVCVCGEPVFSDGELHHALLSRRDVQGMKNGDLIHNSLNVILIHHSCHRDITREVSYEFLCTIFEEHLILNWYNEVSKNFKVRPRALPKRQHCLKEDN